MTKYTRIPIRDAEHKRLAQLQSDLTGKIDSYLSRPSLSDVIKYLLDQQEMKAVKIYKMEVSTEVKELGESSGPKTRRDIYFGDETKAIEYARTLGPTLFSLGDWHESNLTQVNFFVEAYAVNGRAEHNITILEIETR